MQENVKTPPSHSSWHGFCKFYDGNWTHRVRDGLAIKVSLSRKTGQECPREWPLGLIRKMFKTSGTRCSLIGDNFLCTLVQALRFCTGSTAHRGVEVYLYSFMTTTLEGGEGSASRPGRYLPPGKIRYPLYRRLRGLQGPSGQVRKISPHRPVRSQSLSRLRYPAHLSVTYPSSILSPFF
jgi:hypothetical protein